MSRATLRARLGVTAASLLASFAVVAAAAPSANAFTDVKASSRPAVTTHPLNHVRSRPAKNSRHAEIMRRYDAQVRRVFVEARKQRGKPYVYGEDGPNGFDCSGLVRYVFLHAVHRSLPHNAAAQYESLHHISRNQLRRGDLVFTDNGSITHVGIFAGHGHWWVAPETGTRVQLQKIYSAHFVYARVLRF